MFIFRANCYFQGKFFSPPSKMPSLTRMVITISHANVSSANSDKKAWVNVLEESTVFVAHDFLVINSGNFSGLIFRRISVLTDNVSFIQCLFKTLLAVAVISQPRYWKLSHVVGSDISVNFEPQDIVCIGKQHTMIGKRLKGVIYSNEVKSMADPRVAIGAIAPLKPTKVTLFTMSFNNSENNNLSKLIPNKCFITFEMSHWLQYKPILSSIVLSQHFCEVYFISLTVAKPLWDLTTKYYWNPL